MATGPRPALDGIERVRRLVSPVVALLTTTLALCCLVTVPNLVAGWPALVSLDGATPAWAGLALVVAVAVAALTLLGNGRMGSAPPLAVGAVTSSFGLLLSHDVDADAQLVVALLTLAAGVGALVAAGLCMGDELPRLWAKACLVGWLVPLAGGWGLLGWVTLREMDGGLTSLGVHPPGWLVVTGAALVLGWALLTLVVEPVRPTSPPGGGWENAWAGLGGLVAGVGCIVMLVGFQPDHTRSWVGPVVLLTTALAVSGLLLCGWLVPWRALRPAYLGAVVALLTGPSCLDLLLAVSWEGSGPLSGWVAVALSAAGLLGCWAGWRAPHLAVTGGLLVMALAAAGGWVMPVNAWLMSAAAAPFGAGLAAATAGGLRLAAETRMGLRYVAAAGLTGLLFGLLSAGPLAWALGAPVTGPLPAARDGGRILLGLTFAVLVLVSAGAWILAQQAGQPDVPDAAPGRDPAGPAARRGG